MENKNIEIYTDGSSLGNPGPGGWGTVIVSDGKIVDELGGHDKDTTNNRMELQAAIEALKHINKKHKESTVTIHADSAYVLGGITNWIFGWEKNGWKTSKKDPVLNQDLWKVLIEEVRNFKGQIIWQKVKGHSGHVYNDRADEIATSCADSQKPL
jgi:ribonuclease HI